LFWAGAEGPQDPVRSSCGKFRLFEFASAEFVYKRNVLDHRPPLFSLFFSSRTSLPSGEFTLQIPLPILPPLSLRSNPGSAPVDPVRHCPSTNSPAPNPQPSPSFRCRPLTIPVRVSAGYCVTAARSTSPLIPPTSAFLIGQPLQLASAAVSRRAHVLW
jgi:hypothetical protein